MEEWKEYKLCEVANLFTGFPFDGYKYSKEGQRVVRGDNVTIGALRWDTDKDKRWNESFVRAKEYSLQEEDIVIGMDGSRVGRNRALIKTEDLPLYLAQRVACIRHNEKTLQKFLYYVVFSRSFENYIQSVYTGTSIPHISLKQIGDFKFRVPHLSVQNCIAEILGALDDKIELNRRINENLEQQAQALFIQMFGPQINNLNYTSYCLGDLVDCIDNRGKTPALSIVKTDFPIIDVKALSGESRIINYENCTKYVSKETYDTWFRNGHPRSFDILMSTVGSLAELKIFLGTKGCIAQNVIGFRAKNISALYLYQYLRYIKGNLISYNIGSVQPSIKVTHIIKYPIFIPSDNELRKFDKIATYITKEIYTLSNQINYLNDLRNTILPRIMSGELEIPDINAKNYGSK